METIQAFVIKRRAVGDWDSVVERICFADRESAEAELDDRRTYQGNGVQYRISEIGSAKTESSVFIIERRTVGPWNQPVCAFYDKAKALEVIGISEGRTESRMFQIAMLTRIGDSEPEA